MTDNRNFSAASRASSLAPHQRLDVYRVAILLFAGVEESAASFPRGYGAIKDQLRRCATATVLNIAEGAGRWKPADKAYRYTIAQAECLEGAAALELATIVKVISQDTSDELLSYTNRVGAMLTRLIQSQRSRTPG